MKNRASNDEERRMMPCGAYGRSRKGSGGAKHYAETDPENKKENTRMTGPVSIYAIAEMNKRAEECTLKVRSELFRIGCGTKEFQVLRQGSYIQMKHHNQIILADPYEVLMVLKKTKVGLEAEEVWGRINQNVRQLQRENRIRLGWSIAIFVLLVVGAIALAIWTGLGKG
jgi:hypothetical protein